MVLRLRADVTLHKVKVAGVEIEQEVSVRSQQGPAVKGATEPPAGVSEGLLDVIERLEHIEDPRVLVKELPGEGRAAASGGEEQDVLPGRLYGRPAVTAQSSPPGVLKTEQHIRVRPRIVCLQSPGAEQHITRCCLPAVTEQVRLA